MSLRELREKVASGGDLTKIHEPPVINNDVPIDDQGKLVFYMQCMDTDIVKCRLFSIFCLFLFRQALFCSLK